MRTSVGHKFKTVVMLLTGSVIALLLLSTAPLNLASDSTVIDQNPDGMTLAYGVVSIKPHKIITSYAQLTMEPDGLSAADVTLKTLILGAYALSMDAQISGLPAWAESARYDVFARMDDETATTLQ